MALQDVSQAALDSRDALAGLPHLLARIGLHDALLRDCPPDGGNDLRMRLHFLSHPASASVGGWGQKPTCHFTLRNLLWRTHLMYADPEHPTCYARRFKMFESRCPSTRPGTDYFEVVLQDICPVGCLDQPSPTVASSQEQEREGGRG